MNKIIVVICIFTIAFISFTAGYKYGDANGYSDGYKEGYRYDCKDEIKNLYGQVKILSKAIDKTDSALYLRHQRDSLESFRKFREKYQADSLKNWKRARAFNDSLAKLLGKEKAPIMLMDPSGHISQFGCMMDSAYMALRECQEIFKK